jgi:hypothetical protein
MRPSDRSVAGETAVISKGETDDGAVAHWSIDRRIPLALIATLLLQFGGFVWWVSSVEFRLTHKEQRLTRVEQRLDDDQRAIAAIGERLARIEERANTQLELLRRIDGRLQEHRP